MDPGGVSSRWSYHSHATVLGLLMWPPLSQAVPWISKRSLLHKCTFKFLGHQQPQWLSLQESRGLKSKGCSGTVTTSKQKVRGNGYLTSTVPSISHLPLGLEEAPKERVRQGQVVSNLSAGASGGSIDILKKLVEHAEKSQTILTLTS